MTEPNYGRHRVKIIGFKEPGCRRMPRFAFLDRLPRAIKRRLPNALYVTEDCMGTHETDNFARMHPVWSGDLEGDAVIPFVPFIRRAPWEATDK